MRCIFVLSVLTSHLCLAQTDKLHKKGDFFFYWGWNRSAYTNSDIHFSGDDYRFTLDNVKAQDRQSNFGLYNYFHPLRITIPQFNARVGYFITDCYSLSFGVDHMKYVVDNLQSVHISGDIENTLTHYDGYYQAFPIELKDGFLHFEHTDGLNYINCELRKTDKWKERDVFTLSIEKGVGLGVMLPKTNVTLLNKPRHDDFHLSGYGISAVFALQLNIKNNYFIQTEAKSGFINMPDIRTTNNLADRASQHFFFIQANLVFGYRFNVN